jgi:pimeloyl-ACP methyl ester carboxylesterase
MQDSHAGGSPFTGNIQAVEEQPNKIRLLLHGFGGDKHQLRPLGDALPQADGVISMYPSLRAHGASLKPPWDYSVLDFAVDLHCVADVLPVPIDLMDYSYGALVGAGGKTDTAALNQA